MVFTYIGTPHGDGSINLCESKSDSLNQEYPRVETIYPTFQIDTTSYSNVKRFFVGNYYNNPDSGYYYLKPGIGIIQSELYYSGQKRTYKLMRYHIQ